MSDAGERQTIEGAAHRYVVLRHLGTGGMGSTSEVYDLKSGPQRRFAIKIMDPALAGSDPLAKKHFVHEARATMALQHPNVVTVYYLDELADGTPLYAMELLNGKSVATLIRELGRIHPLVAVNLIIDALDGLHEAHKHSLTHQDFKPSNIMTHQEKKLGLMAKVIDFGVVRMQDDYDRGFAGTFAYAAPEQARGDNIGPWTDVFGAAAALHEMLTGKRPFIAYPNSASGLLARMEARPPSILDGGAFDRELAGTIAAALSPKIAERPQTAKAFASLLRIIGRRLDMPSAKETEKISHVASPILRAQLDELTELHSLATAERVEHRSGHDEPVIVGGSVTLASPLVLGEATTRAEGKAQRLAAALAPTELSPADVRRIVAHPEEAPPLSQLATELPSQIAELHANVAPVYVDLGTLHMADRPRLDAPTDTVALTSTPARSPAVGAAPRRARDLTTVPGRHRTTPRAVMIVPLVLGVIVGSTVLWRLLRVPTSPTPRAATMIAPSALPPTASTSSPLAPAETPPPVVAPSANSVEAAPTTLPPKTLPKQLEAAPAASTAKPAPKHGEATPSARPRPKPKGDLPGWDGQ